MTFLKQKWLYCFLLALVSYLFWQYLSSTNYFDGYDYIASIVVLSIIELALIGAGLADLIVSLINSNKKQSGSIDTKIKKL